MQGTYAGTVTEEQGHGSYLDGRTIINWYKNLYPRFCGCLVRVSQGMTSRSPRVTRVSFCGLKPKTRSWDTVVIFKVHPIST